MDLSIVIVNWNAKAYVRKCVASILANPPRATYEVVVIDSGSLDGCGEMLRTEFPMVSAIQSDENLGFARANNLAARQSSGEYLLFLNPDTEIVGGALDSLYSHIQVLPSAGTVGCRLLNSDGSVQTSCIQSIPTITNQVLDSEFLRARWPKSRLWGMAALYDTVGKPVRVEAVSGACIMIRREVFESIGGFNEEYFMYAEDIDLSYRVSRAGYNTYYVPHASIVHHGGGSSEQAVSEFAAVMMREATWRFLRSTRGSAYSAAYRVGIAVSAIARLVAIAAGSVLTGGRRGLSAQKWLAIVKWSVGLDGIVPRYYQNQAL